MSDLTSKVKKKWIITGAISALLMYAPMMFFVIRSMVSYAPVEKKFALSACAIVTVMMTVISFINKKAFRSRIWIILIGIYFCFNNFASVIFTIGSCQIIDEILVSPLHKKYGAKYRINREIDKRE